MLKDPWVCIGSRAVGGCTPPSITAASLHASVVASTWRMFLCLALWRSRDAGDCIRDQHFTFWAESRKVSTGQFSLEFALVIYGF